MPVSLLSFEEQAAIVSKALKIDSFHFNIFINSKLIPLLLVSP
jgi:hypothetical protein